MDVNSKDAAEWARLMKLTSEQEHEIERLRAALRRIAAIENNQEFGGDWDAFEEARQIANAELAE